MNLCKLKIYFYFFFVIFAVFFCDGKAKVSKKEFSFCKELSEYECLPPLLAKEAVYVLENPQTTGTMEDFINSLFQSKEALSFQLKISPALSETVFANWQKNLKAYLIIARETEKIQINQINILPGIVSASLPLFSIYKEKYKNFLEDKFKIPSRINVQLELNIDEKIIVKRSIALQLKINRTIIH
ncbi:MAG: hypothetical protein OEZ22_03585 [Spirochaetia bacterium]|nr:hypothetical protein [Spirochaetia bacterium]